jgi:septal ring factor EnvC (AmiA/AmiB activator)
MKPTLEEITALAKQVAEAEATLQKLEWEINEIGQPAAHELQRRLDALRIEQRALERNLAEALGMDEPGDARMAKIESLLAYIRREEAAVGRDTEFLHQAAPSSVEFAAQAGSRVVELCLRALKRVVGEHHPLGTSVFVNHSPDLLAERYGVEEKTRTDRPL